jgi:hypothetical protein
MWCARETVSETRVNGVAYHWTCLKRRLVVRRERAGSRRESARTIRERTAKIVQELRQLP